MVLDTSALIAILLGEPERDLAAAAVRCVAVDSVQAKLARDAFRCFGKGRDLAGLNYGDCCSYALAAALGRSLLFKGAEFARTDITDAADTL